jgi:uncharacterized protein YcbK (DUF882 family)
MDRQTDPRLPPRPAARRSRFEKSGLSARAERNLNVAIAAILLLFTAGWSYTAVTLVREGESPRFTARVTPNPLSPTAGPETAFLVDAAMRSLLPAHGLSGAVQVVVHEPDEAPELGEEVPTDVEVVYRPIVGGQDVIEGQPRTGGIWNVMLRVRNALQPVPDLHVITTVPLSEARGGVLRGYRIGEWPRPTGPRAAAYAAPRGMVEVTPENQDLQVSRHFRLRDFLTKGQEGVWPKFVVLNPRLLDKLELVIQELEEMGHPVENVGVISAFRHPHYNMHGGSTAGRGALSRHMYGDAMDFFIDNDGNFCMDDLTGDGRATVADIRVMAEAAERVERKYPQLIGGIGVYPPRAGAHCGFLHVDTRGWRSRW